MSVEVKVPAVGESISSGVVSVWHKKSGDVVKAGDALFTLETDKVSTEIAAEVAGTLETLVPEGQEVKIGEIVATIDESKQASPGAAAAKVPEKALDESQKSGATTASTAMSPAVRRIVEEDHVDVSGLKGSGMGGRLTKGDVMEAAKSGSVGEAVSFPGKPTASPTEKAPAEKLADSSAEPTASGRSTRRKMSPLRRKIAAQLVMAQQTAAILTTFNECDMIEAVRKTCAQSHRTRSRRRTGSKLLDLCLSSSKRRSKR